MVVSATVVVYFLPVRMRHAFLPCLESFIEGAVDRKYGNKHLGGNLVEQGGTRSCLLESEGTASTQSLQPDFKEESVEFCMLVIRPGVCKLIKFGLVQIWGDLSRAKFHLAGTPQIRITPGLEWSNCE